MSRWSTKPEDIVHSLARYRFYKCRCDLCVAAHAAYNASRRKHRLIAAHIDPAPLIEMIRRSGEMVSNGGLCKQVERWETRGIDVYEADRQCVKRGYHPFEVFGEAWFAVPTEEGIDDGNTSGH